MRVVRSRKMIALVVALLAGAAMAATGLAGVWSQWVAADSVAGIHFRVVKTSAFDFDSGWHIHPGPAIVQVQQGSFQITQGSCTPKTVGPGETYIEVPYEPVRAVATGRVVWTTTLLGRIEDSLMTIVPSPCS